jgi:hypothetical protein
MAIPPVLMSGSFVFCPAECIEIFRAIRCKEFLAEKPDSMIPLERYGAGQKRKRMQQ